MEFGQAEPLGPKVLHQNAGDQIAGYNEKNIDSDEASAKKLEAGMVKHHHGDCDRP